MAFLQNPGARQPLPGQLWEGKFPGKVSPLLLAPRQAPPCRLTRRALGPGPPRCPSNTTISCQQTPISSPEGIAQRQGWHQPKPCAQQQVTAERAGRGAGAEFSPASVCQRHGPGHGARSLGQAGHQGQRGAPAWLSRSSRSRSGSEPDVCPQRGPAPEARALRTGGQGGRRQASEKLWWRDGRAESWGPSRREGPQEPRPALNAHGVQGRGGHGVRGATFRTPALPAPRSEACARLSLCLRMKGPTLQGWGLRHRWPGQPSLPSWERVSI